MTPILIGAWAKPAGASSAPTTSAANSTNHQRFGMTVTSLESGACRRPWRLGVEIIAGGKSFAASLPGALWSKLVRRVEGGLHAAWENQSLQRAIVRQRPGPRRHLGRSDHRAPEAVRRLRQAG